MLIGSSDSRITDRGKLRVTLHHNLFDNVGQRTPRGRFGQVHVYNNYYRIINNANYGYSWGVGIESMIYAENNYFKTDQKVAPDQFISVFKGTALHESGTRINGTPGGGFVDLVATYNAANDPDLSDDVGWTPTLFTEILDTQNVIPAVESEAGPLNW